MNILKYSKISIILAVMFITASCSDFLQPDPYGAGTTGNFWKTEDDVKQAINAFASRYAYWEGTAGRGIMWFENCSDNMVTGRNSSGGDAIKNFEMVAGNDRDVKQLWPRMYQLIAMTNDVFRYVPGMNISEALKSNALGQAHFYRGFAYLWLSPYYGDNGTNGGIPIMTVRP